MRLLLLSITYGPPLCPSTHRAHSPQGLGAFPSFGHVYSASSLPSHLLLTPISSGFSSDSTSPGRPHHRRLWSLTNNYIARPHRLQSTLQNCVHPVANTRAYCDLSCPRHRAHPQTPQNAHAEREGLSFLSCPPRGLPCSVRCAMHHGTNTH